MVRDQHPTYQVYAMNVCQSDGRMELCCNINIHWKSTVSEDAILDVFVARHYLDHGYGSCIAGEGVEYIYFTIAINLCGSKLENFSILVVKLWSHSCQFRQLRGVPGQ